MVLDFGHTPLPPRSANIQKIENLIVAATAAMTKAVKFSNTPEKFQTGRVMGALVEEAIPILSAYGMTPVQIEQLREDAAKALAIARKALQNPETTSVAGENLFISITVATFRLLVSKRDGK